MSITSQFQSTLPVWGGTGPCAELQFMTGKFQSTLPVWGGTLSGSTARTHTLISIHPPRVGRDMMILLKVGRAKEFQSTLPVWGGTHLFFSFFVGSRFQSTLPVWGGTGTAGYPEKVYPHFNPPSPCGEGRVFTRSPRSSAIFQSTLPVWGGTHLSSAAPCHAIKFQSTLPVWGGTMLKPFGGRPKTFQSTLPVWGGTPINGRWIWQKQFQSTLPVWGGTN